MVSRPDTMLQVVAGRVVGGPAMLGGLLVPGAEGGGAGSCYLVGRVSVWEDGKVLKADAGMAAPL